MRQTDAATAAAAAGDDDADHHLMHFWFRQWPDHQAPRATDQLLRLVLEVDRLRLHTTVARHSQPVVVHCRSVDYTTIERVFTFSSIYVVASRSQPISPFLIITSYVIKILLDQQMC